MTAYYNEIDADAAAWLRELIKAGHIAPGEVDERDIREIKPSELRGFTQCHFFAGIGTWSLALRNAGWPDSRPVWTGSCPCQPFSAAGRKGGQADERHLWPHWFHLISQRHPPVIFGEQVASKDGLEWLDLVLSDLEGKDYAAAPFDLCAAGIGAPHIRQRLWLVAHSNREPRREGGAHLRGGIEGSIEESRIGPIGNRGAGSLAHADRNGAGQYAGELPGNEKEHGLGPKNRNHSPQPGGAIGELADTPSSRSGPGFRNQEPGKLRGHEPPNRGPVNGFWANADWLHCIDGKARAVEPIPQQMADGFAESMGCLRPEIAKEIEERITGANITEAVAREALSKLWENLAKEAVHNRKARGLFGIHPPHVLLAFMRELERKGWRFLNHIPSACWENAESGLRAVWEISSSLARSSYQRESSKQLPQELDDAMPIVSQIIASAAQMSWPTYGPLAYGAPARVVRLRGYGNGITAPLAEAVISAFLDFDRATTNPIRRTP